jgi:hypothetical protein
VLYTGIVYETYIKYIKTLYYPPGIVALIGP